MKSNYFLLYHSVSYEQSENSLLLNTQDENFDEIAAFILSIKKEKLDYFLELEEFKKLSKKIIINGFLNSSTLYEFCSIVLDRLNSTPELVKLYLDVFTYLSSKSLITDLDKEKLFSIFEPLTLHVEVLDTSKNDYIQNKEAIFETIDKLKELFESDSLIQNLQNISNYMQKQVFSIGITGVMNVGKSTFINALLGDELLGSSVVAETANLSVIKYAAEPYTRVRFFNSAEFEEIVHTFDDEPEQKQHFLDLKDTLDLDKYVQEDSYSVDIKRDQLHMYTSASDKSGFCHIVKDVELGVDMEFLKDSIEIVDTPGLDDTLIVRESITQGYVSNCDLLIHLMNVNQSATQKDVDFIIEAITKQYVSSVLVLLTKADNITKDELKEVINYTRTSIQNQLSAYSSDDNVAKVMSSIKFLSISAITALKIRKNKKQDTKQELLKQSGIVDVETLLHETLFSSNTKNETIVQTAIKRIGSAIKTQLKRYAYDLELYSKDEGALENELREFNSVKEINKTNFKKIDKNINTLYTEFEKFLEEISLGLDGDMADLKSKLIQRVSDEIIYSFKKDASELKETQLKMIIDKTISHGFIDIVREHKFKLEQKMLSISKNIELSFKTHNIKVDEAQESFSMSELFEKNSNSSLNTNIKMILKQVMSLIAGIKASKVDVFKEKFALSLDDELSYVKVHVATSIKELNESISKGFFENLRKPIVKLELEMKEFESSLEKQINLLQNKDEDKQQLQIKTQNKINSLKAIQEGLQ